MCVWCVYLFLEASDLVAFGVYEGALRLTGDDITRLFWQGQQLPHLLQALRLAIPQLFLHACKTTGKCKTTQVTNTFLQGIILGDHLSQDRKNSKTRQIFVKLALHANDTFGYHNMSLIQSAHNLKRINTTKTEIAVCRTQPLRSFGNACKFV